MESWRRVPPASAVERIAKGLVYNRDDCLQLLGEENYPEVERGYRLANGSSYGVKVPCHPDPIVQAILEQKREAEIVWLRCIPFSLFYHQLPLGLSQLRFPQFPLSGQPSDI